MMAHVLCGPQLSSQHALVCGDLKEMQKQLCKLTEDMRKREEQEKDHQRENWKLKEEQDSLQRCREQLEDDLQQLRYHTHWNTHQSICLRMSFSSSGTAHISVLTVAEVMERSVV